MLFMNEWDIDEAAQRAQSNPNPVIGKASRFLSEFKDEVNRHSDGWPYWNPPVRAAAKLMSLVENSQTATEAEFKKALVPIKAFYTRHGNAVGMKFPEVK